MGVGLFGKQSKKGTGEKRDLVAGARLGLCQMENQPGPCPGAHHTMISASGE